MPSLGIGLGLLALRWWALLAVQVLWRRAVGAPWVAVAAVLAVGLASGGEPTAMRPGVDPWAAAGAELVLGALLGLVVSLPGHALVGAVEASARVLGTAPRPWQALVLALVGATALSLGLHRPLLQGGSVMLERWPVGEPLAWSVVVSAESVARLAHGMALLALTLATPVLLVGAMAELVVGLVGRGSSFAGVMAAAAGPWLRVAAALVATGASWAAYDAIWAERALGLP